jgi:hypothetical protein
LQRNSDLDIEDFPVETRNFMQVMDEWINIDVAGKNQEIEDILNLADLSIQEIHTPEEK